MRNLLVVFYVLLLVPAIGLGQEQKKEEKAPGQGYLFAAPSAGISSGGTTGFFHFGGGGEVNLYKGLGIGAEIGYLSSYREIEEGVGVFSLNGLYSFKKDRRDKAVPFVSGGYSMFFREGHMNAVNFGGGLNYWFSDKTGLRLEFRDYVHPKCWERHIIQVRIGITFR